MPTRRHIPRLSIEEATAIDNGDCWLLGSDDELDEATRAVKRRRIETLGESYLQGKPLFIASASLHGPFDKGWVNLWRKNRRQYDSVTTRAAAFAPVDHVAEYAVPDTNESRNHKGGTYSTSKSIRPDVRGYPSSPRTTPYRESGQSNLLRKRESSSSHKRRGSSADLQPAQTWLKRDKKVSNIQYYDPPKSPSSRYASSGADGLVKLPKNTSKKAAPGLARPTKCHQTDLRNVRRNKLVSSESLEKHIQGAQDSASTALAGKEQFQKSNLDTEQRGTLILSKRAERETSFDGIHADKDGVSMTGDQMHQEGKLPASASSVHIVPPSSRLPEFEYRLAKGRSKEETGNQSGQAPSRTENMLPPVDTNRDKESSSFKGPLRKSQQNHTSIPAQSSATLTYSEQPSESLTESEKLPSAQIVPNPPGTSNCFISLHSAEYRASGAAETGTTRVDEELSTQAAFELAQKSFQDDLVTPYRSSQSPSKIRKSVKSTIRRITPFANVNANNSAFDIKIGMKSTPGTTHNMNTQAMIDAFTPFTDAVAGEAGNDTGLKSNVHLDAMKAQTPEEAKLDGSLHSQPQPKSQSKFLPHSPSVPAARDPEGDSLPPLPLTLSGTTPATNQQDGQGHFFSQETFDVSQVIKDAGSWLQRSFDINEDLREVTKQSPPPSVWPEISFL